MIKWTGLAPWEFEFLFPGSLTSTFLVDGLIYCNQPPTFPVTWEEVYCSRNFLMGEVPLYRFCVARGVAHHLYI